MAFAYYNENDPCSRCRIEIPVKALDAPDRCLDPFCPLKPATK